MRNPQCYAAELWDCSRKLTGEHPFSRVLARFTARGAHEVAVTGHPWQGEQRQRVGIESLKAKVLCSRHNEALSGLDTTIGRFGTAIADIWKVLADPTLPPDAHSLHVFRGDDIERWMLKALCGAIKMNLSEEFDGRSWLPPIPWLNVLFDGTPFPPQRGLFLIRCSRPGTKPINTSVYFRPGLARAGDGPEIPTFRFGIAGLELVLLPPSPGRVVIYGPDRVLHRPGEIRFFRQQRYVSLLLGWKNPTSDSNKVDRYPIVFESPARP
jgi:hypothetical protein